MGNLLKDNKKLMKEFNFSKNGNIDLNNLTLGSNKKIWWICKKGHSYEASVNARYIRKNGCPYCSNHRVLKGYNDLATINPHLSKEWNYKKNGNLTPQDIIFGSSRKVWWQCKNGHEWQATIKHRMNGTNCPSCSNERHISLPEKITFYYIKLYFVDALENYSPKGFGKRDLDIYIPSKKVGIEYDGSYYHTNIKRDIDKNILCRNNNITLYRIRDPKNNKLNDYSIDIYLKNYSFEELSSAIEKILKDLKINNIDININRDLTKIYDQMEIYEKEFSLKKINPKLAREWNYEKNGNLTPDKVLYNSGKKVWWKCEMGHEWQGIISSRKGCPYCCNQKVLEGYNDLATVNPQLAREWNYEKNQILPTQVTPKTPKKVWWKCEKGHEWQAVVESRTKGANCPICYNKKVLEGYNDLATVNPKLAREWNYEKNGNLKPADIVSGSNKKVWWKCEKGHEWQATIVKRNAGKKCPICSNRNVLQGYNDLATTNSELVKEWNYEKNGNLKPTDIVSGSNKKVWWKCKKGHEWETTIVKRTSRNQGCPLCAKKINSKKI